MKKFAFLFCFFANTVFADGCPITSNELSGLIKVHAQEIKGSEYCEYRKIVSSKGVEVALYSIEGPCFNRKGKNGSCGNMHFRYLTGIVNGKTLPPFEVGKRGGFSANDFEIQDNIITLKGFKYGEDDPQCCPSVEEKKLVVLTESGFEFKHP
jgi:hypothetical protein